MRSRSFSIYKLTDVAELIPTATATKNGLAIAGSMCINRYGGTYYKICTISHYNYATLTVFSQNAGQKDISCAYMVQMTGGTPEVEPTINVKMFREGTQGRANIVFYKVVSGKDLILYCKNYSSYTSIDCRVECSSNSNLSVEKVSSLPENAKEIVVM